MFFLASLCSILPSDSLFPVHSATLLHAYHPLPLLRGFHRESCRGCVPRGQRFIAGCAAQRAVCLRACGRVRDGARRRAARGALHPFRLAQLGESRRGTPRPRPRPLGSLSRLSRGVSRIQNRQGRPRAGSVRVWLPRLRRAPQRQARHGCHGATLMNASATSPENGSDRGGSAAPGNNTGT